MRTASDVSNIIASIHAGLMRMHIVPHIEHTQKSIAEGSNVFMCQVSYRNAFDRSDVEVEAVSPEGPESAYLGAMVMFWQKLEG